MLKMALLALWAGTLAIAERARPAAARPASEARVLRNGALWATNAVMNPLLTLPIAAAAASFDLWSRPAAGWPALLADLLVLDLWAWAWHLANHRVPALWRFHQVHHRDAFLDVTSAVRFHPGEVLISALARAPLIVALDVPLATIVLFDAMLTAAALFHHSNLRLPPRGEALLRLAVVTPSHHWVHHHARRADTDSNYGVLLTLWDRLFRTWSPTVRTKDMAIGAEGAPELPLERLALVPFGRG
jgi:sterol desaturase/sphingolipid hydroxylase (fatty acid hydroxylase superfamily)